MIKDKDTLLALVLPGGGLCGVYTIQVMKCINDFLVSRGKPTIEQETDLFFGTSTGGIICGGLVGGMPFDTVYNLYMKGKEVFVYAAPWYIPNKLNIPRYKTSVVMDVFKKGLPDKNIKMKDIYPKTGKHLMLMSVNKNWMKPKNEPMKTWNDNYAEDLLTECVERTFAASVYFGNINDDNHQIVYGDGGEGDSNNPIIEAYASICKHWPDKKIKMLHIGTGYYNVDTGYKEAKKCSNIKDALKVPMMAKAQSMSTATYLAGNLVNRDHNFSFMQIDTCYKSADMDVLDGLDKIIDYKNAAIETMTLDVKQQVYDFLTTPLLN
jgi:patatin-like phospholipase/acyl hydrolase